MNIPVMRQFLLAWLDNHPRADVSRWKWIWLIALWTGCSLLLLGLRPGYPFPPYGGLDGWIYTAYQWDLKNQIAEFGPTYYGSRLSWILPGALLHTLLPPLAANLVYKLAISALLASASAAIVCRALGLRAALLAVACSVLSPQIIAALHTDYIDTPVFVFGTATLACITLARDSRHGLAWIFGAGVFFTAMVIANLGSIATVGVGLALFHLVWLRWNIGRHAMSLGVYVLAASTVIGLLGFIHQQAAGGQFNFVKAQWDMLFYMNNLGEKNPWRPSDWLWLRDANWLVLPAAALLWGIFAAWVRPATDERTRQLTRALTLSLAVALLLSVILQVRGLGVLAYNYYASFLLCLSVPLLLACLATANRTRPASLGWLLSLPALLAIMVLAWDRDPAIRWLFHDLPFLHPLHSSSLLVVFLLLVALASAINAVRRSRTGMPYAWLRPELFLAGMFLCSMPVDFQNHNNSDRLRERYASVHTAYRTLAREFPAGSYRFWLHPDEPDGVSLASTKLWGGRLFTLDFFPKFTANALASTHEDQTLVVPSPPGEGPAVLATATRVLRQAGYTLISSRVISLPGEAGTGFDLACFSLHPAPLAPGQFKEESLATEALLDLKFFSPQPYIQLLGRNLYGRNTAQAIDTSPGYPVFTRTDPRDHLATNYQPLQGPRQISVVATMPADGHCIGVIQIENCQTIAQIGWIRKGRFVHTITIPEGATSIRLYLQSTQDGPTALPTRITLYPVNP